MAKRKFLQEVVAAADTALFDRCKPDLQVGKKMALINQQALLLAMIE